MAIRDRDDPAAPVLRRGTPADARRCHTLLWQAATDLGRRHATPLDGTADDWWDGMEPVHGYLGEHAAEWWVAEDPRHGELLGYARSMERGGLLELTEFFVRPDTQSAGLGRRLLERAFPIGRGETRTIIATSDVRALSRYYRADTVVRFPIFSLKREPAGHEVAGELTHVGIADPRDLGAIVDIEREVLGYPRGEAELAWLAAYREAHLFRRRGRVVGFAFVGTNGAGPIAALDPGDLPQILAVVDQRALELGLESVEFEIPAPNEVAIRHLLGQGFRIDPWFNFLMSNRPFGQFDRFIGFSPPIFL